MLKVKTEHIKNVIDSDTATTIYNYLVHTCKWHESIKSKRESHINGGFTRMGSYRYHHDEVLSTFINSIMSKYLAKYNIHYIGTYINYYRNGWDWCPNHNHPGQCNLIISLGATRKLLVGKKKYALANGDILIFGSAIHGIEREPEVENGRIGIAVFFKLI